MIPVTDEESDGFIADVSAAILATMAADAFHADCGMCDEKERTRARIVRAEFAVAEAGALLAELQLHARVQREADGSPIDMEATDPTKRFCAHGASLADHCEQCARGEQPTQEQLAHAGQTPATTDLGNVAAVEAFRKGLQGDPQP